MNNNDVLRRLRFALNFDDRQTLKIFKLTGHELTVDQLHQYMAKQEADNFAPCRDKVLVGFLDGLILDKRGPAADGKPPVVLKTLNNNDILRKVRIALALQSQDILDILALADFRFSNSELSALFRKPDHRHYKLCKDQILRNFLIGLTIRERPDIKK